MKRVLITGGAGFIGHRVSALLAARTLQVAVLDNLSVGMRMPAASAYLTPFQHDIRDIAAVQQTFQTFQPDAVIHLAALHHIPTCEAQPELAQAVNISGTQTILDAAAATGVQHFLLASSAAVYDWSDHALREDSTPLRATDVYSRCKLQNERQVAAWTAATQGHAVLARIFNVIGHDDPNGHLIPDILKQIDFTNRRRATIALGNTAPKRDYTHADDTARGMVALLDHLPRCPQADAYNLSFGAEYSVTDLVAAIGSYLGRALVIEQDPARRRKIDRLHLLGDPRKTAQATGWRAELPLREALHRILSQLVPNHACVAV